MRRINDLVVVAGFLLAIALPVGGRFLDPAAGRSALAERRRPGEAPAAPRSLRDLRRLPHELEAWLGDDFGFRAR